MKTEMLRRLHREDDGQLLLLVLCYAVIGALLVTVVVNVSKAYLYRRALLAAADGAALAAANQPDLAQLYSSTTGSRDSSLSRNETVLPLSEQAMDRAVEDYVLAAQLEQRFPGFQLVDVSTDGARVTVAMAGSVRMPFVNVISANYRNGYPVRVSATARSAVER